MSANLTSRQREVLKAIVESYVATGEPISSGMLATRAFAGMSSATIRNEMAALAEAGLLDQPHTSAGRIPSAQAFRYYVAQIQTRQPQAELQTQIDSSLAGLAGPQALLEGASHLLASLSSGVGVAIGAAAATDLLEHIHFSRLNQGRVLAVLVTRSGIVRDRVLAMNSALSSGQLERAGNFLNEHFRGWNLERVRLELARRIDQERNTYQQLRDALEHASELWSQTLPAAASAPPVFIDGVANLAEVSGDRARLRELLAALEQKQQLVELLNAYIDARQDSVRVVFDLEQQSPAMAGLVLIAAPARSSRNDDSLGTIAILGPKRMQYERAINAVAYIADLLHRMDGPALDAPAP